MSVSFRARIAASAALIFVAGLTAVAAFTWERVRSIELDRLEARLCIEARRFASQPFSADRLARLEADVAAKLRLPSIRHVMIAVEPAHNGDAFASAGLSTTPPIDALHWSPGTPRGAESDAGKCSHSAFDARGKRWQAALYVTPSGRGLVAADEDAASEELREASKDALATVIPLALALTAIGAWLLTSLATRPVTRLREAMHATTRRALNQRLPVGDEDQEFADLIAEYNRMLERLESSFEQAARFSADAAHELRTPLTVLQARLEQAIAESKTPELQSDLIEMLDEVGRLAAVTRKLLLLSQADAGRLALHITRVDLSDLLTSLAADATMVAGDRDVSIEVGKGLSVAGDAILLRQLVNNLVGNALRYCPPGGRIGITARAIPNAVEVLFSNTSRPIEALDRAHLFDRFWRLDTSRTRDGEGAGLGLSIAREIARAHAGDLILEPGPKDEVTLRLHLPCS